MIENRTVAYPFFHPVLCIDLSILIDGSMLKPMLNYADELLQIVYPAICNACGEQLSRNESIICLKCQTALPQTNYWNVRENKMERHLQGRFSFEYAVALYHFSKEGGVQNLLHELKYKGKTGVGFFLGEMLGEKLAESDLPKPDAIIPLPLFWKKEKQRGYNQSQFFADGISTVLKIPVASKAVKRIRESESQTRKNRFDRIENVEHIFRLKDNHKIENKHILLVDDVLTTGATIEACADTLLKANNVKLSIATIAVA